MTRFSDNALSLCGCNLRKQTEARGFHWSPDHLALLLTAAPALAQVGSVAGVVVDESGSKKTEDVSAGAWPKSQLSPRTFRNFLRELSSLPTGFRGAGVTTRAVKGHAFGLNLSPAERAALIAFLKTI